MKREKAEALLRELSALVECGRAAGMDNDQIAGVCGTLLGHRDRGNDVKLVYEGGRVAFRCAIDPD